MASLWIPAETLQKELLKPKTRPLVGWSLGVEIPAFDLPASTNMADFRARVEQLPDLDNPASFGMAPNADRSLQRINSAKEGRGEPGGGAGGGGGWAADIETKQSFTEKGGMKSRSVWLQSA